VKKKHVLFCLITVITLAVGIIIAVQQTWADSGESKPAVSDINAKISGGYADLDAASTSFGTVSVTFPLTHRLGLSIDGLGGDYSANSLWGVGGTLFWRNPDKGLLGIMGSNVQTGADKVSLGGVTGELYLNDQFSILTDVGYQSGGIIEDGVFSELGLRWYIMNNLAIGTGLAYAGKNTLGMLDLEYMPDFKVLPGLALFAYGGWGESDYSSVMAGVRYYFGSEDKTLKERHRQEDPQNMALKGLLLAGQAASTEELEEAGDDDDDDIVFDDDVDDDGPPF
jgi:hypothetical protein